LNSNISEEKFKNFLKEFKEINQEIDAKIVQRYKIKQIPSMKTILM